MGCTGGLVDWMWGKTEVPVLMHADFSSSPSCRQPLSPPALFPHPSPGGDQLPVRAQEAAAQAAGARADQGGCVRCVRAALQHPHHCMHPGRCIMQCPCHIHVVSFLTSGCRSSHLFWQEITRRVNLHDIWQVGLAHKQQCTQQRQPWLARAPLRRRNLYHGCTLQ